MSFVSSPGLSVLESDCNLIVEAFILHNFRNILGCSCSLSQDAAGSVFLFSSYFSEFVLWLNLEIKEHLRCVIFIYNSSIITNEAKIARLVAPTIENIFTHFSLTDLKWRPDVPFNQQVCSVFFWICPISPANPHLVSKKRGGTLILIWTDSVISCTARMWTGIDCLPGLPHH